MALLLLAFKVLAFPKREECTEPGTSAMLQTTWPQVSLPSFQSL